jgi:hypothetical protein
MRLMVCVLLVLFSSVSVGCNSGPDNNEVVQIKDFDPVAEIKKGLEGIKSSGRIGSNFGALKGNLIDLKKTDAAKAESLEKELNDLAALSDAAKIKAKAAEIIGKM